MASTFSLQLSQFAEKAAANADKMVRGVALDIWGELIQRSPVDTGRFRQNWQLSITNPPAGVISVAGTSEAPASAPSAPEIAPGVLGKTLFIGNNLPYAVRLEYGHSNQAPQGMVGLTLQRFQSIADDNAHKVNP